MMWRRQAKRRRHSSQAQKALKTVPNVYYVKLLPTKHRGYLRLAVMGQSASDQQPQNSPG